MDNTVVTTVFAVFAGLAAFVGGCKVFYDIGVKHAEGACANRISELESTVRSQLASIEEVTTEAAKLREQIRQVEAKITAPPTEQQADGLSAILDRRDQDVWLSVPARRPAKQDAFVTDMEKTGKRVLSVINLKGGVGKTTISANLAAYFDRLGKKVLLIDADYQGSLSDVMSRSLRRRASTAKIDEWLSADVSPEVLIRTANSAGADLPNTSYVTAFYSLASIETKLMVAWLMQSLRDGNATDLRYALARILMSDSAREKFDIVIIDCPPRLSTAAVNALCTSSDILIPSVPDATSLEAVVNFTEMASKLKAELNPSLRLAGIVPTMTTNIRLTTREKDELEALARDAVHFDGEPYIFKRNIPHKAGIAGVAGKGIAYIDLGPDFRTLFGELGAEVAQRLGI